MMIKIKNIRKYEDEDKEKENENKEETQNITLPFITSPHYELKKYDYNNTIGMVKEIANNQVHIDEKFDVRKYLLEKMLKTDTLPSVDNYQVIIKERIDKIKNERRKKNIERAKIQSESLIDKGDIALREIEENALKWEKRVEELDKEEEILNNINSKKIFNKEDIWDNKIFNDTKFKEEYNKLIEFNNNDNDNLEQYFLDLIFNG